MYVIHNQTMLIVGLKVEFQGKQNYLPTNGRAHFTEKYKSLVM